MRRTLYIAMLLGLTTSIPVSLRSQVGTWQTVQSSPSLLLMDVCFLPDGTNGWAVGSSAAGGVVTNAVFRTSNGGTLWELLAFPSGASEVQGVFFVNTSRGWTVGKSGSIYTTTNGGGSWSPQLSGSGRQLSKAYFINANTGWVTGGWQDGSSYLLLKTTNAGQTWQDLSFGSTSFSSESIFFINENIGWVGGRDNTLAADLQKSTDGGITWTRKNVPVTGSNSPVTGIKFATLKTGWAVTSSIYDTGPVLYSSDGGENWVVQTTTSHHYHVLDVRDSLSAAIAAFRILGGQSERLFLTTNGGVNWTQSTPPISSYTYGIEFVGNRIWFAADQSSVVATTNYGSSWQIQLQSPRWNSISWATPASGWIVAGTNVGTDGVCLRTTNAGVSWFKDNTAPGGGQVLFVNQTTGWMLWPGNSATIWRTTNGGGIWTQHGIGSGSWTGRMFFATSDSGWAFGSNGNLRFTSNGGVSWTSQSPGSSNYIEALKFVNSRTGWLAGGYGSGSGFISRTTNGGATWTLQTPATSAHVLDLFFLNERYGWASMLSGGTQKTTDGGSTWLIGGSVAETYAQRIHMVDTARGWLIAYNLASGGGDGRGYIYRTENGGSSWNLEFATTMPKTDLTDLSIQRTTSTLWVTGNNSSLFKYDIPTDVVSSVNESPERYGLMQNYPNPFNPVTTIKYQLPRQSHVSLKVFDALGREVAVLVDGIEEKGFKSVRWDAGEASSGVYFCRIQAGGFVASNKLLLLK